jgi:aminoglycoside phosphotransferase
MSGDAIPAPRLRDCLAVTRRGLRLDDGAALRVTRETGGLFNFVLRVEAPGGVYFFKQYLDDVPNPTFDLPKIPAASRAQLACQVQRIAADATRPLGDIVPAIVELDEARCAFLMASAAGDHPLIDDLSAGRIPAALVDQLPRVLALLHQTTYQTYAPASDFANTAFRDFKLGLQYDGVARELAPDEAAVVMACKQRYQRRADCVTHGDLNSRNIIVGADTIGVIDFEMSHLGAPAYDLAYILCEVLISLETWGAGALASVVIGAFLDRYFETFRAASRADIEAELTQHLAIQTLYRFWGPSRRSWTFYVDDARRAQLIARSRALLMLDGPVTRMLEACEGS